MIALGPQTLGQAYEAFVEVTELAPATRSRHKYELRRWSRLTDDPPVERITGEAVQTFRQAASADGIGVECVETTLNTVYMVLRLALSAGRIPDLPIRGRREHSQPRKTATISVQDFARFVEALEDTPGRPKAWHRAFWGTLYFSALRIGDARSLRWHQLGAAGIPVRASKTGKLVTLAVHPILERLLAKIRPATRDGLAFPVGWKTLYRHLAATRARAGVAGITPQAVRKLAARMFERAHPGAGRLVLGHALPGASGYYLAEEEILAMAVEKLTVPDCFLLAGEKDAAAQRERRLLIAFRGLRPADQEAALRMTEGMRRG